MIKAPSPQNAGGTQNATPEATVRPRQSARQVEPASAPWLPPGLSELLPRVALPAAILAIPVVAAFALQMGLGRTQVTYDGNLLLADGGADEVTALQWSPTDGALYVGTRSGSATRILADGTADEILSPRDIDVTDGEATSPVQSFHSLQAELPVVLYQDRLNPANDRPSNAFAATRATPGLFSVEGGLFASVEANNGSAVVGRAAGLQPTGLSRSDLEAASRSTSIGDAYDGANQPANVANQAAPQQIQQQQAQQLPLRTPGEQLKGEPIAQQAMPTDSPPSGPARYNLTLFRDLQNGSATSVGEIFGIEDVRAVAALPGTDTVIAGDGEGNVFAIDASQQISGASPETYIRGIGQHEAAIVEIAVAAQPNGEGVLFATRAEDRSIKVWRGSVSRASQLIPLGDYASADVTTPGSTWVREQIQIAARRSRATDQSMTALLSMSEDGRRILARRANGELIILDLPTQSEDAAAAEYGDVNYITTDTPAMLSRDGSRLIIAEATNSVVEMFELLNIASGQSARLAVASFRGLAGIQFRRFAFDGTGQRFIAIATNGSIYVQNVATPDQAVALTQYQGTGVDAAISPDGSLVAVADASGQITIHSAEDGGKLTIFNGPQNLRHLAFDSTGKRLRASAIVERGSVVVLNIHTYSLRNQRSSTFRTGLLLDVDRDGFIPYGDRYFMHDGNAGFSMIDIDGDASAGTLEAAANATGWVSNLDGSRIATLGGGGNISLFRQEESPTANGPMPVMADNAMRLSADGRTLIVGSRGGELYLAQLDGEAGRTGYRLRRLALPAPALQYELAPDGASIAVADADGTVTISDLIAGSPAPDVPASQAQIAGAEMVQAGGVAVAQTVKISGHGAPITAMALSPDGERIATASLDGRLRITGIAWAKLVHRLPFAALPTGPEREKLEPQPLDDSPYALMGVQLNFLRNVRDDDPVGEHYIVVYNASRSLAEAREARTTAADAGLPDSLIYRRRGFFRGVFAFPTQEARDAALPRIQEAFSGAYARDDRLWCGSSPVRQQDFIDCDGVVAGSEPPPAMAN